jgi:hypothetical protein
MSNNQRQRRFRERNPDYSRRYHAQRRAEAKAGAAMLAALRAQAATKREPLMLPAPAVRIEIPGVNTIPATATPIPAAVPVQAAPRTESRAA